MIARSIGVALVLMVLAGGAMAGQKKAVGPEDAVKQLYGDHFKNKQRFDVTFKQHRALFAKELLALVDKADAKQAANPNEVVGLDFDPIINAQEEASSYEIKPKVQEAANVVVPVTVNFGKEAINVKVRLAEGPAGTWTISNLIYEKGDLLAILKSL